MEAVRLPRSGFAKDSVEVEGYVRGFARRRPDVAVSILRFANIMGPGIDTPMTRYFSLPVVPTVMGFDGRMQFTHEDDALAAMETATWGNSPGTYNVGGEGVLMLSQAIAMSGRINMPLPRPLASVARDVVRRSGYIDFTSEQIEYLKYGRGIDTSRIRERLGFTPQFSTLETFESFLQAHPMGRVLPWDPPERDNDALCHRDREHVPMSDAQVIPLNPDRDPDEGSSGGPSFPGEQHLAAALRFLRRRLEGSYEVDDFGFDREMTRDLLLPSLRPLYEKWFRVEVHGIENVPDVGGALIVANHSGTIALDSLMTQVALADHHPAHRELRMLGADLVFSLPFVGTLARRAGHTLACNPDAERLLAAGRARWSLAGGIQRHR